jgi:hypothetical protein
MLKCGARIVGPAAFTLVLATFLASAAYGETVIRRGAFQSKIGTEEVRTCGDFVWLITDENGNGKKDPGEKWVFRVENCAEMDALLDMGGPDPDPACGDGHADTGEQCGEPGLGACGNGFQCNDTCQCEAIPDPGDPTGKCKDGTPDRTATGNYSIDSVFINKNEFASFCVPVPAGSVSIGVETRNRASVTCGNFALLLRHTDTVTYPNVKFESHSAEPAATITTLGGTCGFFPPGCPSRLPPGSYEARITGLTDECTRLAVSIAVRQR